MKIRREQNAAHVPVVIVMDYSFIQVRQRVLERLRRTGWKRDALSSHVSCAKGLSWSFPVLLF